MENRTNDASKIFSEGFNCAQAVFSAYSAEMGIDANTALRVAASFGAGMARLQEACGAVTGAFMVIGAAYGSPDVADEAAKTKSYGAAREFEKRFMSLHGTILCRELLGVDLNTEEGQRELRERDLLNTVCAACVRDSAKIVEELTSARQG